MTGNKQFIVRHSPSEGYSNDSTKSQEAQTDFLLPSTIMYNYISAAFISSQAALPGIVGARLGVCECQIKIRRNIPFLLHNSLGTKTLEGLNDLLSLVLGHVLLHDLGHSLDELFAVD